MAKVIQIIDDNDELIEPKKAAVFLFDDEQNSETSNVTVEMVGMSGRDLHMIVSAAICLGQKLGMFGDGVMFEEDDENEPPEDDNADFNMVGF